MVQTRAVVSPNPYKKQYTPDTRTRVETIMAEADNDQKRADPRGPWISAKVQQFLPHLKPDKIKKSLGNKDSAAILDDFVLGEAPMLLVNGDTGAPLLELPDRLPKNKWLYLLKKNPGAELPAEDI